MHGGQNKFIFTEKIKKEIKHLARCAMNVDFIADAIGTTSRTMQNHPEIMKLYNDEYTKIISNIAESLLARASDPDADSSLKIFVMKTRAKWKEDKSPKLPKEYVNAPVVEKFRLLDQYLSERLITEQTYVNLNTSLVTRWKAEDHEGRLVALENEDKQAANKAVVKKQENNG